MKISTFILALATAVAALCLNIRASHAYQVGDSRWCHVADRAGDTMTWDCDYDSIDDCQPAIVNGGGGFCALNPGWRPDPAQSESAPAEDTILPLAVVPIPKPKPH